MGFFKRLFGTNEDEPASSEPPPAEAIERAAETSPLPPPAIPPARSAPQPDKRPSERAPKEPKPERASSPRKSRSRADGPPAPPAAESKPERSAAPEQRPRESKPKSSSPGARSALPGSRSRSARASRSGSSRPQPSTPKPSTPKPPRAPLGSQPPSEASNKQRPPTPAPRERLASAPRVAAPAPVKRPATPPTEPSKPSAPAPQPARPQPAATAPAKPRPKLSSWRPTPPGEARGLPSDPTELASALDKSFDAVRASSSRPPAPGLAPSLSSEGAHESFDAIAALHLRPVRELMMEMHLGAPPRSWIALCVPAAQTVRRFAEQINRDALVPRLDALIAALESASEGGGARIEGAAREEIQRRYAALVASLPSFSSVDAECDRRERSIARALLEQVPGVHALVLERLASAGLTGLSALLRASADELAAATAIPTDTAARIVAQLARYRSDSASIAGSADLPIELERLKQLCDELRRVHAAHERAAEAWSADALADKRRHRTDRARVLLQIEVVLARLGELERIDALGRLCFERKISDLEAYLQQAAQSSARN